MVVRWGECSWWLYWTIVLSIRLLSSLKLFGRTSCAVGCSSWSFWLDHLSFDVNFLFAQVAWSNFVGESSTIPQDETVGDHLLEQFAATELILICIVSKDSLLIATSARTSMDLSVATSDEQWVRGRVCSLLMLRDRSRWKMFGGAWLVCYDATNLFRLVGSSLQRTIR